jgi:hypothetical protein
VKRHFITSVFIAAIIVWTQSSTMSAPDQQYRAATVRRDCAPWDGAAMSVTITTKPTKCDRIAAPYIHIAVYELPIRDGRTVKLETQSQHGQANRCLKEDACEAAESGEVVFDNFKEGSGASGRYRLKFRGGETVSGSFDAKWCEFRGFCG